jgi:hypothetical protein
MAIAVHEDDGDPTAHGRIEQADSAVVLVILLLAMVYLAY